MRNIKELLMNKAYNKSIKFARKERGLDGAKNCAATYLNRYGLRSLHAIAA